MHRSFSCGCISGFCWGQGWVCRGALWHQGFALRASMRDSGEGTPQFASPLNSLHCSPNSSDSARLVVKPRLSASYSSCCLHYSCFQLIYTEYHFRISIENCMLPSYFALFSDLVCFIWKCIQPTFYCDFLPDIPWKSSLVYFPF